MRRTGNSGGLKLPKGRILSGKRNFDRLFREGSVKNEQHVSLRYVLLKDSEECRMGFITPRKLGKAHERNRIRRQLREAYRLNQQILQEFFDSGTPGFHAVLMARTVGAGYYELEKECRTLLENLKMQLQRQDRS